ncbi:hypothetical protein ONZ45_g18014 [Pleurotus djamor]|nr:hypothetical protein ONZ45_g18014 [Pleurotus djamor]
MPLFTEKSTKISLPRSSSSSSSSSRRSSYEDLESARLLRRSTSSPPPPQTPNQAFLQHLHEVAERDPRFHQPTPSPLKRGLLVVFLVFLFWLALYMRTSILSYITKVEIQRSNDRYSEEFFFRPAASPVITTTLADGSVHVKGTLPTAVVL